MEPTYNIAISFAEEDRNAALALSLALELKGVKNIYYYPDKLGDTAGKVLLKELRLIYTERAKYTVILLSKKYLKKPTAREELEAIYKRMLREPDINSVVPVVLGAKVDLSDYPALKELAYLDWNYEPKKVADILISFLGKTRVGPGEGLAKPDDDKISISQINNDGKYQENNMNINF